MALKSKIYSFITKQAVIEALADPYGRTNELTDDPGSPEEKLEKIRIVGGQTIDCSNHRKNYDHQRDRNSHPGLR